MLNKYRKEIEEKLKTAYQDKTETPDTLFPFPGSDLSERLPDLDIVREKSSANENKVRLPESQSTPEVTGLDEQGIQNKQKSTKSRRKGGKKPQKRSVRTAPAQAMPVNRGVSLG